MPESQVRGGGAPTNPPTLSRYGYAALYNMNESQVREGEAYPRGVNPNRVCLSRRSEGGEGGYSILTNPPTLSRFGSVAL